MKRFVLTAVVSLLLFCALISPGVHAMNTGFQTEDISSKELKGSFSILYLPKEPKRTAIECFDVNEEGVIALCTHEFRSEYTVRIYSRDGVFQYGLQFQSDGMIQVEWNDTDSLNLYYVRGNVILTVDSNGKIVEIRKVINSIESSRYSRQLESKERMIGDTTYSIQKNMGPLNFSIIFPSYTQLIVRDASGEERVLYDVRTQQIMKILLIRAAIGLFVYFCLKQSNVDGLIATLREKSKA